MAGEPELIKVRLTDEGEDSETPWAHDLGPAPGPPGSRKVRLANVPFMHAKPTWGDVIIVVPVEDDFPLWDRGGVAWDQIGTRIAEDGGRWAMIVDYAADPDSKDVFRALAEACAELEIVCEGAWGPRDGKPGRAYLAVKHELDDVAVMQRLRGAKLPCELMQIHPSPASASVTRPATSAAAPATSAPRAVAKAAPAQSAPKSAPSKAARAQPAPRAAAKAAPAKPTSKPTPSKVVPAKPASKARASATPSAKPAAKQASSKAAASRARASKAPTKSSKPATPAKPKAATASRTKRR